MKQKVEGNFLSSAIFAVVTVIAVFSCFIFTPSKAFAAINSYVSFQGKLTNPDGTNVANNNYSILFTIYSGGNENGGGSNVWSETQGSVQVTDGIFHVNLGSANSLSSVDFSTSPLYLSVKVGSDPEMLPRILLTSSPYAFNSDKLDGLDSGSFGQLSVSQTWTNTNLFQPTTNITSAIIKQTSGASPTVDIFNVQSANGTNLLQFTGSGANNSSILLQAVGSASNMTLNASGTGLLTIGNTGTASNIQIGNTTGAVTQSIFIGNNSTAGSTTLISIGSDITTSNTTINGGAITTTNNQGGVTIGDGYSSSDTTLTPLRLDSTSTYLETANTCSGSANGGSIYYNSNTASGAIRACINGTWEDLISTAGLGILAFGIVSDSGDDPGDLPSLATSGYSGPCKVSYASATTVHVEPCVAYSGGRKVIVNATTITLTTTTANRYENICLTGANGQPAIVGPAATQTSPTIMPTFNGSNPTLCLATLRNGTATNGSFATNGQIYDVRTFNQTLKEYQTSSSALGLGYIAQASGTGVTISTATAVTGGQRGVVVASNGATSANNPNVIIATHGPAYVVASAGTAAVAVTSSGTAGFAATNTSDYRAAVFAYLGVSRTTYNATCNSAASCMGSLYLDLTIR